MPVCLSALVVTMLRSVLRASKGANHTCECFTLAVNWAFQDHSALPKNVWVQLDNASTNKNMLFFAWLGLYVYHGIFEEAPIAVCPRWESMGQ